MNNNQQNIERTKFKASLIVAFLFILVIWVVKAFEIIDNTSFYKLGIFPRTISGLIGILTAPLIHSDINHIVNNTITIFILTAGLVYFYRDLWYRIIIISWLLSGILVWIGARSSYHIGCSGLIYAEVSFIFFSGVIRKNINLMAISLLVVFLYGSLIWGILPIFYHISWESHLFGAASGLLLAIYYRNQGPPPQKWSWMFEEEDEDEDEEEYYELEDETSVKTKSDSQNLYN